MWYKKGDYSRLRRSITLKTSLLRPRDVNLRVAGTRGFVPAKPASRQAIRHTYQRMRADSRAPSARRETLVQQVVTVANGT
jgi:hypothetical protein